MEYTELLMKLVHALAMIMVVMGMCAYSVVAERKVSSWIQGRLGPNRTSLPLVGSIPVVGPFLRRLGMFQPMADGLKFLFKEDFIPGGVNKVYYYLAPVIVMIPALLTMVVVPIGEVWVNGVSKPIILADLEVGFLFLLAVSSLGVYGVVLGGWAANSKYPFLGAIRSSAQMVSYELAMGLAVLPVFIWANGPGSEGTLSLVGVVGSQKGLWNIIWQPVSGLIYMTALFAETNRLPFDMAESETDLVGGFHTEYGAFKFGMFFLAEYAHMIVGSGVFVLLFLGGWHFLPGMEDPWGQGICGAVCSVIWFLAKVAFCIFFFIWVRWTVPRFRYDQVMKMGWKVLLPLALVNLAFYILLIAIIDKF